jgi:hypothetical protein
VPLLRVDSRGAFSAEAAKDTSGAVEAVEAAGAGAPCNALSALALSFLAFLAFRPSCVSQVESWESLAPWNWMRSTSSNSHSRQRRKSYSLLPEDVATT